ncbi:MAG: GtrA family protein [Clostridia bacterium]|nr:GtrA family protein [Clostridia bacterium]
MKKFKEIFLYLVFGVLTTVVNLVVFKCFENLTHVLIVNIIAWVVSVAFAFFTNKLFVFESKSWKSNIVAKEAISFVSARLFSLGVEELGIFLMITVFKLTPTLGRFAAWCLDLTKIVKITMPDLLYQKLDGTMMVKLILAVIVVIMNYVFSKLIIFKKKDEAK